MHLERGETLGKIAHGAVTHKEREGRVMTMNACGWNAEM